MLLYDNLVMGVHLLHEEWRHSIKKFATVGAVCAYPRDTARIPIGDSIAETLAWYAGSANRAAARTLLGRKHDRPNRRGPDKE